MKQGIVKLERKKFDWLSLSDDEIESEKKRVRMEASQRLRQLPLGVASKVGMEIIAELISQWPDDMTESVANELSDYFLRLAASGYGRSITIEFVEKTNVT